GLPVLEADRGAIEAGRTGDVADEFQVAVVPDDPQNVSLLGVSAAARECAGPGEVHDLLAGHQGQCSVHCHSVSRPTDTAAQQRRAVGSLRSSIAEAPEIAPSEIHGTHTPSSTSMAPATDCPALVQRNTGSSAASCGVGTWRRRASARTSRG